MIKIKLFIPIQKIDEEKRLVYGIATAEERDNTNEIFDYASSKPYIEAWSNDFKQKTDGKSCGNLRAMHQAVSAGKLTELNFDDDKKIVTVCAKVIDENEWQKVLEGTYTGFSFGGSAISKWQDDKLNAIRYTLLPAELSLADKPCVPSAVFFDVVKVDGTIEKRKFKIQGGNKIMVKIEKNMDLTQFLELINNVKTGLAEDENAPQNLKDAVENLAAVLAECTQTKTEEPPVDDPKNEPEKVIESGCDTNKIDVAKEIAKIFAPLQESLKGISGISEAIAKTTQTLEQMQTRLAKLEKQPEQGKVILKTVTKTDDGKDNPSADPAASALAEIKKVHKSPTWAY